MEKNNKDYVEILNLKEMTKLINYLGENTDIKEFDVSNITFNSNNYEFIKKGNSITIKCSNGKKLEVEIYSSNVNYINNEKKYYYYYNIKNTTSNGDSIVINKTFVKNYDDSYKLFQERRFDYHDLVHGCEIGYATKEDKNYHSVIWNEEENRFNFKYGLDHLKDGYIYSTGIEEYLISKDLNKIITINDKLLPDKEELYKFNVEEEKRKIQNILNCNQFNEITRNMIIELMNKLKKKEIYVNQIKNAYEQTIIPKSKEIIKQEEVLNDEVINSLFNKKELLFISEVIKEINNNKRMDINKEQDSHINKFLNNLSLVQLTNLRNELDNNISTKNKIK